MQSEARFETLDHSPRTLELKAILLVDDDKQLATALQWILADENFLVDVAHDGEEAMLKVQALDYDLVVCDLMMPRLRGDEFYFKAKEMRPRLGRRFVFITGFAADPRISDFLTSHDVEFLVKPFPVQRLIKRVRDLIG
ncbi:MAG: response regulator [Chthoniobacterales bacterium]